MAKAQSADRQFTHGIARQARGGIRIMVASDPEPLTAGNQEFELLAERSGQALRTPAVMKGIAQADDDPRLIFGDHRLKAEQRRGRVVRWDQDTAPSEGGALF